MLSLAGLAVVVVGVCIAIGTPILVSIFFRRCWIYSRRMDTCMDNRSCNFYC